MSILGCDGFECEISARQQGYASVQQYMGMNAAMCHGRKMLEKISDNLRTCWRKLVKIGENYKIWWCQYIMGVFLPLVSDLTGVFRKRCKSNVRLNVMVEWLECFFHVSRISNLWFFVFVWICFSCEFLLFNVFASPSTRETSFF